MRTFDHYQMLLTPLSPIHIGTNEDYEPTNYVIEKGLLHEFDQFSASTFLNEADRRLLLDISSRKPDAEMIQAVQRFFADRKDRIQPYAIHRVPVAGGVESIYTSRIGKTANVEAGGKRVINRLEIERTAYEPFSRRPIIYGSSIKGAMRTALLERIRRRNPDIPLPLKNSDLQHTLFKYRSGRFELDPLRLIQVSDAPNKVPESLPSTRVIFGVNRKKAPVVDEQGTLRPSSAENLYQFLECIIPWLPRGFQGQLNIQAVDSLNHSHASSIPAPDLQFSAEDIAHACNDFYKPILLKEIEILRERGYMDPDWEKSIQTLLRDASERFQSGKAFLLRVGRHSGAESVTLNEVRSIKIMRGKGQSTNESEALTLWLAASDNKNQTSSLLPFGWVLVELVPPHKPMPDWSRLDEVCAPHLTRLRSQAQSIEKLQSLWQQARQKIEAEIEAERHMKEERLRTEANEANEARQKAAQEQSQKEALLQAYGDFPRVKQFVEWMHKRREELRHKPSTRPNDPAQTEIENLIKEAQTWDLPEAKQAAARAIQEWLPKVLDKNTKFARELPKKLKPLLGTQP